METAHLPVMPAEVVRYLGCRPGGTYVDGTLGGGGHTVEILKVIGPEGKVIAMDRDADAIAEAKKVLRAYSGRVTILKENFKDIKALLSGCGIDRVDGILLDLGVSSYQLETPARGFSFRFDARLDMRMDRAQGLTAHELVNTLDVAGLERIFRTYGEERYARRIARAIERERRKKPVETTGELKSIVVGAVPRRPARIHPATKVFQALRIAVNDELENLKAGLTESVDVLGRGGRMVVISFHSLEDRIVKRFFRDLSRGCVCPPGFPVCVCGREPSVRLLTRRAVTPAPSEIGANPRARSARLRAVERL